MSAATTRQKERAGVKTGNGGVAVNRSNFDQAVASDKARKPPGMSYEDFDAGNASMTLTTVSMYGATSEPTDTEAEGMGAYASMSGGGFASDSSGGAAAGSSGAGASGAGAGRTRDASTRCCGLATCRDFFKFLDVNGGVESDHRKPCREFPDPLLLCLCAGACLTRVTPSGTAKCARSRAYAERQGQGGDQQVPPPPPAL